MQDSRLECEDVKKCQSLESQHPAVKSEHQLDSAADSGTFVLIWLYGKCFICCVTAALLARRAPLTWPC